MLYIVLLLSLLLLIIKPLIEYFELLCDFSRATSITIVIASTALTTLTYDRSKVIFEKTAAKYSIGSANQAIMIMLIAASTFLQLGI